MLPARHKGLLHPTSRPPRRHPPMTTGSGNRATLSTDSLSWRRHVTCLLHVRPRYQTFFARRSSIEQRLDIVKRQRKRNQLVRGARGCTSVNTGGRGKNSTPIPLRIPWVEGKHPGKLRAVKDRERLRGGWARIKRGFFSEQTFALFSIPIKTRSAIIYIYILKTYY